MAASNSAYWDAHAADPVSSAAAVLPSDTVDLSNVTTAVYVGITGNMQVTMTGGQTVIFQNLPVGWHPIRVSRIWNTGTTATQIMACWR